MVDMYWEWEYVDDEGEVLGITPKFDWEKEMLTISGLNRAEELSRVHKVAIAHAAHTDWDLQIELERKLESLELAETPQNFNWEREMV